MPDNINRMLRNYKKTAIVKIQELPITQLTTKYLDFQYNIDFMPTKAIVHIGKTSTYRSGQELTYDKIDALFYGCGIDKKVKILFDYGHRQHFMDSWIAYISNNFLRIETKYELNLEGGEKLKDITIILIE